MLSMDLLPRFDSMDLLFVGSSDIERCEKVDVDALQ